MQDKPAATFAPITMSLRDGREVLVREIRAEDSAGLVAAFERLSADARYSRFMAVMQQIPEAMLEKATHPAPEREFALVALGAEPNGQSVVAGARYAAAPGSDVCEFAVTVNDAWQGQGLAGQLLRTLIDVARARGLRSMEGYVLSSNTAMRRLARRMGFADEMCSDDATLRVVTLALENGSTGGA